MTNSTLSAKQRKHLKGLAHGLDPVVMVGRGALSDGVVSETQKALESHELIKVRVDLDDGHQRREVAREISERTGSELIGTIGKIAILYRQRAEDPDIRLP